MTPNEQIITAPAEDITDAAKAELLKKEFDSNFTKVSEALQTPEKADTIAHLLDTNFKK
jgi:hypothetical protein